MPRLPSLKPRLSRVNGLQQIAKPQGTERKRGSAGVKDRNEIRRRDMGMCQACKRQGYINQGTQVDHIVPLHQGGPDSPNNKELLCDECHAIKTAREAAERI